MGEDKGQIFIGISLPFFCFMASLKEIYRHRVAKGGIL
jgi:hypothetical protein